MGNGRERSERTKWNLCKSNPVSFLDLRLRERLLAGFYSWGRWLRYSQWKESYKSLSGYRIMLVQKQVSFKQKVIILDGNTWENCEIKTRIQGTISTKILPV
jgi:hypothetical protein